MKRTKIMASGVTSRAARSRRRATEPTSEQLRAADNGVAVLDSAIARGRWTDAETERLRALLPAMTHEQRMEVMTSLSAAINDGAIVPDGPLLL